MATRWRRDRAIAHVFGNDDICALIFDHLALEPLSFPAAQIVERSTSIYHLAAAQVSIATRRAAYGALPLALHDFASLAATCKLFTAHTQRCLATIPGSVGLVVRGHPKQLRPELERVFSFRRNFKDSCTVLLESPTVTSHEYNMIYELLFQHFRDHTSRVHVKIAEVRRFDDTPPEMATRLAQHLVGSGHRLRLPLRQPEQDPADTVVSGDQIWLYYAYELPHDFCLVNAGWILPDVGDVRLGDVYPNNSFELNVGIFVRGDVHIELSIWERELNTERSDNPLVFLSLLVDALPDARLEVTGDDEHRHGVQFAMAETPNLGFYPLPRVGQVTAGLDVGLD